MPMTPVFSVLIPSRNRLDLLRHAVDSVRRQNFSSWEVIVADNASEDDYAGYVVGRADSRLRLTRSDCPLSVTENWNRALSLAAGDYIIMLGDDDALAPGYFEAMAQLIEKFQRPEVIYSMAYHYAYPGAMASAELGYFVTVNNSPVFKLQKTPYLIQVDVAQKLARRAMMLRHEISFNAQHFLYQRAFIESQRNFGPFYQSPYPDYFACFSTFLRARSIVIDSVPRVIIGISPKSFGSFLAGGREAEGSAEFLTSSADQELPICADAEVAATLQLPGSNHIRNWLIAALSARRRTYGSQNNDSTLRRYKRIQLFDLALRSAYQASLSHTEFRRCVAKFDPPARRFAFKLFELFLTLRRAKNLPASLVPPALSDLLGQYAPLELIGHDIGPHQTISDAVLWLERAVKPQRRTAVVA